MMKRIRSFVPAPILFACISWAGCNSKPKLAPASPGFTSFEISYHSGWAKRFSFMVDSSKIYFVNHQWDTTLYGSLPDSMFAFIDSSVAVVLGDTTIRSTPDNCDDCGAISMTILKSNKKVSIVQYGDISKPVNELVKKIEHFIGSTKHSRLAAIVLFETRAKIYPVPPILDDPRNFASPK